MKWYGLFNKSLKLIFNKKSNLIQKQKRSAIQQKHQINLNYFKTILYIPNFWQLLILKNFSITNYLYIYIYSSYYFFYIPITIQNSIIKYDLQTKSLLIQFLFINNFMQLFFNNFKSIFFSFSKIFFKKLKFKGKGYYIFKNKRNTIAFQLGYSHIVYLYSFFINVKFLSKTSIFMFGLNNINILKKSNEFFNLRKINIFTGKGIRFSRQIIYKKTGKISSYR